MYYTYMLRCRDDSIYTGITTDLARRWEEHTGRGRKAAGYTRTHEACGMLAAFRSENRGAASRLEYHIKTLSKPQKERLAVDGDLSVLSRKLRPEDYHFLSRPLQEPERNG